MGASGGASGGLSVRRDYRMLAPTGEMSVLGNRVRVPPYGLFGGHNGAPARYRLDPDTPDERPAAPEFGAKKSMVTLRQDQVVGQETAGGGGYGDPLDRDPSAVARDLEYGYVSAASAYEHYGVVGDQDGHLDEEGTLARRQSMRADRQ